MARDKQLERRMALVGAQFRLTTLEAERAELLALFPELTSTVSNERPAAVEVKKRRPKTAGERRAISERMKAMWLDRSKPVQGGKAKRKPRVLSAATRRKMVEAARRRAAKYRAQGLTAAGLPTREAKGLPPKPRKKPATGDPSKAVEQALRKGASAPIKIAETIGLPRWQVTKALADMLAAGTVTKTGQKRSASYALA